MRSVVLLRGVNLGKRNKVPMAWLRDACGDLGLTGVSTYIASGNLICDTPDDPDRVCRAVEAAILDGQGVTTDAIHRTHDELAAVLEANPFVVEAEKLTHVMYLGAVPDPERVADLEGRDLGGDEVAVVGREAYADFRESTHSSRLSHALVSKVLGVPATARNWRTARRLVELTADPA